MKVKRAKNCDTCRAPIGWLEGDKIPRNLDGTPHACPEEHTDDPIPVSTDAPLPQSTTRALSTPEYFAITVGARRRSQFASDLYEAGTLLAKLGFFDAGFGWCSRVQDATMRLDADARLTAWLRIGKALLVAMNMDGYGERASEELKKWIEMGPSMIGGKINETKDKR